MAGSLSAQAKGTPLPAIRPELALLKGAPASTGAPTWLLHDPVANRFVQLDIAMYCALSHWPACSTVEELIARVNAEQMVALDAAGVGQAIAFLQANRLTVEPAQQGWRHFAGEAEARRQSVFAQLLHNYLFFRIPLFRPQAFLEMTLPIARPLASRAVQAVVVVLGVIGLYLVSREWDAFFTTFQGYFSWEGALLMGLALALVKAAHELGHAYTAAAYGCRVHTMGLAFVLMAPLLYTDVSDAWRLRDRRQRLAIDSAGIKVELGIAAIALFLWAFMPDGPLRSVAFTLSVISVGSSLAINLNPFMRFDGYYLLAEALGVDNLQPRAFALGRWQMRELLFGLGDPPPELLPRRLRWVLVGYAWATWVYRLLLFVGIALVVYHFFFKLLGILMFAVEIIFFVGRPIMREFQAWYRDGNRIIRTNRTLAVVSLLGLAIGICIVPISTRIEIPAVAESGQVQPLHASRSAKVAEVLVRQGAMVKAGTVLVRLASPEIEHEIRQVRIQLSLARLRIGRGSADAEDRAASMVLRSHLASLSARLAGLERERVELELRAPFDGRVAELDSELRPGRWVSPKDMIALVATNGGLSVRGYISEQDRWRLQAGIPGRFVPDLPTARSVHVRIDGIATAASSDIEIAALASTYSGRIAVMPDARKRLVPSASQYFVRMTGVDRGAHAGMALRGVVIAQGQPESMLAQVWRRTLKVLVRESGV
ncbi:MAG: biotin/lipoyl-binding protein [Hyphomicrobiaceae bacterium]|nr:biotin/lipoyl-binding protein [Hyphomicrobiaceae bacterium]